MGLVPLIDHQVITDGLELFAFALCHLPPAETNPIPSARDGEERLRTNAAHSRSSFTI